MRLGEWDDDKRGRERGNEKAYAHEAGTYAAAARSPSAGYRPVNFGGRFSANAARPSFASSVAKRSPNS